MGSVPLGSGGMGKDRYMNLDIPKRPKISPSRRWIARQLDASVKKIIERHFASDARPAGNLTLVDLGCGAMPYRYLWEKVTQRYIGVDMHENSNADFHYDNASGKVPLDSETADVVLSTQVLEHVPDPAGYLAEAERILKPDGKLVLSTHGFWMDHPSPRDYWRWTAEGLKLALDKANFRVLEVVGVLGFAAAALHLLQDSLSPRMPRMIRAAFVTLMQSMIRFADSRYSANDRLKNSAVYMVVAVKKHFSDSPCSNAASLEQGK